MASIHPPHRGVYEDDCSASNGCALWHVRDHRNHRIGQFIVRPGTEEDTQRLMAAYLDLQDPVSDESEAVA